MRPYHPANLKLLPYASWRVVALAWCGKALGVQFHVHGIPFGGTYREPSWSVHSAFTEAAGKEG